MSRHPLCGAVSALALATSAYGATPVVINGGGAASQTFDYAAPDVNGVPVSEMSLYNSSQKHVAFGTYWSTISGSAQAAMLTDDLTCLENKVTGQNNGNCNGTLIGGADTVHYAVSESVLNSTQIATWATSSVGFSVAGNLIQIPAMGTGQAIVVNDPGVTSNGQAAFTDNDLCGIFSGLITDFSQITDGPATIPSGVFKLLYRSDSAGNTFSLTNHLSAVCTTANTQAGVTFTATSTFASIFPNGVNSKIPNAVGISGLAVLANTLAGLEGTAYPQAISYISPDWTSVDSATSSAKLLNGEPSPLLVAELANGSNYYLPTEINIALAFNHPTQGTNLTPPSTAAQGANPALWVPIIQKASVGYPIISYSVLELPQCYAVTVIKSNMLTFLRDHYGTATNTSYTTIQSNNGLVPVSATGRGTLLTVIKKNILGNFHNWHTDLGDKQACAGKAGR